MFPRNCWYVAAWPREVGRTPLARMICEEPVVLYRKEDGGLVALEDRCCHRHLPLSLGVLIGDHLRCGYHGLSYDETGACVDIPGQNEIPAGAKIARYPVVEKWGCVWIWMGDPQLADPAKIPDVWWAGHKDWKLNTPDMVQLACDYRLIADNVLDATHLTYVHATTIGASSITDVEPTVTHDERHVRVSRWMYDCEPPPSYKKAGHFDGHCDRWAAIEFRAPNFSVNFAGCVDVGFGGEGGSIAASPRRVELVAISLPTPVTRTSCYYFFAFARAFGHDDPEVEKFFTVGMPEVFREDYVILEAQQRLLGLKPNAPQISLVTDRGSIMARRMIERMVQAEAKTQVA